jgi:hypothetical protein
MMRHIPSGKIERWLGSEAKRISDQMRGSYFAPIHVGNCPGDVWVTNSGDFIGRLDGGGFMSLLEYQYDKTKLFIKRAVKRVGKVQHGKMNAGFASLSDLINEATVGAKRREFSMLKTGATGVVGVTSTLWYAGGQPTTGATAASVPGGTVHTDVDTGAFLFTNPTGGDTQHFVTAFLVASVGAQSLLMYDRLFAAEFNYNSTAAQAVTGVPTRYQNTTANTDDSAENNFLMFEIRVALAATAHNFTPCTYTDQSGNAGATLPSLTGNSSGIASRLDHPAQQFFAPLATGDNGIKALTNVQLSAAVATGNGAAVIGHPLVFIPLPLANLFTMRDGVSGGFNLARIYDDACITFLELTKSATTATTYTGNFLTVAG